MEKLINSIPRERIGLKPDNMGVIPRVGLCLRWSTGKQKWICQYGTKPKKKFGLNPAIADDPVEALAFFVENFLEKDN